MLNQPEMTYYASDGDEIFYRDDNHISLTGAKMIAPSIARAAFDGGQ